MISFILPACCQLCGLPCEQSRALCAACEQDLPWNCGACPRCALSTCPGCNGLAGIDRMTAALHYRFPVDHLVCRFKFNRNLASGRVLSAQLSQHCVTLRTEQPELFHVQAVVPVPLHPGRQFMRLFNQAELLAQSVAPRLDLPVMVNLLRRRRRTRAQSGLDARQRKRNLERAFELVPRTQRDAMPRSVALVDDVITTGTTLQACAAVLRRGGCRRVVAWAAARADQPGSARGV